MRAKRVAVYARVSTDDQSVDLQLRDLRFLLGSRQHGGSSYAAPATLDGSTRMPGPMVVEIAIFLR